MTVAAPKTRTYTADEYLALETESNIRSEFRDGEIVEMTGGTPELNKITRVFIFLLTMALRKQLYSIFVSDQRFWLPKRNLYTYKWLLSVHDGLKARVSLASVPVEVELAELYESLEFGKEQT